jgi:hypothetical protein
MTVRQLIQELQKIKGKDKTVYINLNDEVTSEFEIVESYDFVDLLDQ